MQQNQNHLNRLRFHRLKLAKKTQLTKNSFALEFELPPELEMEFSFVAGQYVTVEYHHHDQMVFNDFSLTNAPFEQGIALAIKIQSEKSSVNSLYRDYEVGDEVRISEPRGRFTIPSKPHEFRTIVCFAAGIGITPIFSHIKDLLKTEPRTRIFLFYGNKTPQDVVFKSELDQLVKAHQERFEVHYFYTQERQQNFLYEGRIDESKLELIINQFLHLDDTDEESTIWDAVDEVLICGKGPMVKTLANACYKRGIPKKNIHFELFEAFNEDIYPLEKEIPLVENIQVEFTYQNVKTIAVLDHNRSRILQQLIEKGYTVPYSCKSGICGTCECHLDSGEVDLLENEYLTESEIERGQILPCVAIALDQNIVLNFDPI